MAETVVRSLIRLIATLAIFAAVYFFIVKPILDTTNDTINRAFEGSEGITEQIQSSLENSGVEDFEINLDSQKEAMKLLDCIQRANQNVEKIERCNERFG
jgi:hypothetical protein